MPHSNLALALAGLATSIALLAGLLLFIYGEARRILALDRRLSAPRRQALALDLWSQHRVRRISDLPDRLASDVRGYLSAIDAKEERIERFKTGYAVVRNSSRFLPLAATNVARQAQEIDDAPLARSISMLTQDMNLYLATPTDTGKERLTADMEKLREDSVAYPRRRTRPRPTPRGTQPRRRPSGTTSRCTPWRFRMNSATCRSAPSTGSWPPPYSRHPRG